MIAILRGELECSSSSSGLTDREHPVESIHQRSLTLTYLSLSLSLSVHIPVFYLQAVTTIRRVMRRPMTS